MKTKLYLLLLFIASSAMAACGSDSDDPVKEKYISSVEVMNKERGEIEIDNFSRTIKIELVKWQDYSDVRLKIGLEKGVSMYSPESEEASYDLRESGTLTLMYKKHPVTFQIQVVQIDEPLDTYKGWPQSADFGSLPQGLKVYKSPETLQGQNAIAYIAVADMSKISFEVLGESGYKTPSQFYQAGGQPIVINAGYFWAGETVSLIGKEGQIVKTNGYVYSGGDVYYPTRGVFGQMNDNTFRTDWVFTVASPFTTNTYAYPAPYETAANVAPTPANPAGAWPYEARTAIGGGPVLVKGGVYKNTWEEELFGPSSGIGATARHPRTAIGYTADNKLILFVCEGRNMTPDVPGFTLEETAKILLDLGCVEALNLDGGGSTCMLVNGLETIKPSDGTQRQVVTAIGLQ
ncbi:phosphodiester glycosidase family protein [Dysgonomonas sp. 25]|uniref:phosphodiester glycosidase family protein n=1 Tax=Dysgonomonas sp. 25 TaxID=2302933 RepID=UPI0013D2A604|nr:phosphodiester glycosidase family protein [Dysgonomonas sp. 25]NDV69702.1 phosphodiester glycosidase family protein [Dysgonomonas sp. 25]